MKNFLSIIEGLYDFEGDPIIYKTNELYAVMSLEDAETLPHIREGEVIIFNTNPFHFSGVVIGAKVFLSLHDFYYATRSGIGVKDKPEPVKL